MACTMVILFWVRYELSFDRYHRKCRTDLPPGNRFSFWIVSGKVRCQQPSGRPDTPKGLSRSGEGRSFPSGLGQFYRPLQGQTICTDYNGQTGPPANRQPANLKTMDRKIKKKKLTPKRIIGILFAVGFLAFCFYQFVLGDYSIKLNVQRERITISTVKEGPFQEYIPVIGTVIPKKTIYLDAVEGGRVEKVISKPEHL